MSLGMELGLGSGDFVLDGDPAPPPQKGGGPPPQIFGLCFLRPNGWMDEAGTWHGGRPQPRGLCVRWRPSPLPKGAQPTIFGPYLLRPNGCMDQDVTWYGARPRPRRLCVRRGPRCPLPKRGGADPLIFRPMFIVTKMAGWMKQLVLGTVVGLSQGECVRWGPSPSPKGAEPPPQF